MNTSLKLILFLAFCLPAFGQRYVKTANTLNALLALNPNDVHTNALVLGRATVGDGLAGIYYYNASLSTATNDNPPTILKPNSYNGRWILVGAVVPRATNSIVYFDSSGLSQVSPVTTAGLAILDDADATAQRATIGSAAVSRVLYGTNSISGGGDLSTDRVFSLLNDSASPGINKVYGTDGAGIKGWKNDPAGSGSGDVVGPATATDNAIARFDTTTGKLLQNSAATIADTTGDITAGKFNGVTISGSSTPALAVTGTATIAGVNNGDQTITLSGDATGTGTGPITVTIPNGTITTSKMGGDVTAAGKALLDDANAAAQRVTLQLVPGTDVQAFDAELLAWAGLTSAADTLGYFNGSGTATTTPLTAAGRAILDDIDAAAQRATLDVPQTTRSISTQHSLTGGGNLSADRTLSLVNDSASPGNNKVYGTDGSGVRGWKNDPAGGGSVATDTIWNAAGDLVVGTGSDTASRLAPPTQLSGSQLYYGPNGVEWVNPATHYLYRHDFLTGSTFTTEWGNNSSGGAPSAVNSETGEIGILQLVTGTGTTGYRHNFLGGNDTFSFGNGRTIITWKVKIPQLSVSGTDGFNVFAGVYDHWSSVVDGAWVQCTDNVNSGKWEAKFANNSSITTVDTGVASSTSWVTFTWDVNAGATEVKLYANGSLVHTETGANIPGSSRRSNIGWGITKYSGTNTKGFYAGYLDVYVKY